MDAVTELAPMVGIVAACDFLGVARASFYSSFEFSPGGSGLLIQAASGSGNGLGGRRTKRSGWAW